MVHPAETPQSWGRFFKFGCFWVFLVHVLVCAYMDWLVLAKFGQSVSELRSNTTVKAAPFGRWTLRDKPSRSAPYLQR
jgi:hypothetical protein